MQRFTAFTLLAGLVRQTWIITGVAVVSCAAFAANAAASLVAADYLTPEPRGPGPPGPREVSVGAQPAVLRPAPARLDGSQLVERNMFCSSCGPASAAGEAFGTVQQPAVLIAIDLASDARATLRVLATDVQGSWGVGDAIPGLGQVDRIGARWIDVVDGVGRRGRLSLLEAAGDPGTAMPERAPAAEPWAERIKKLGEQDYEVDRSLVRELVGAGGQAGVRMIPIFEQGEVKGVRLAGVRPGSIPLALGLRNGDILTAIDGAPLRKIDQLLDLYARLEQLSAVELAGTRAGKPLVRTLRLR